MTNDRALSVLVHGESGAGKSTFGVTAPTPQLFLDVEAGSRFLQTRKVKWNPMTGEAPPAADGTWDTCVVQVHDFETAMKAYEWLKSGQHPFKSVILDSISELQAKAQESINGRQQMQTQHWGQLLSKIAFFCRDLRDLTAHPTHPLEAVIVTAMSKSVDGVLRPSLQGQVASQVPYWFDISSYLFIDQVGDATTGEITTVRRLLTTKHPEYEAKSRVPGLPGIIDSPNITVMLDNIFGKIASGEEEVIA